MIRKQGIQRRTTLKPITKTNNKHHHLRHRQQQHHKNKHNKNDSNVKTNKQLMYIHTYLYILTYVYIYREKP